MVDNADEDDDFGFFSGGKSRLSSLFPSQPNNEEDVNQSLRFVAPKQPKRNEDKPNPGDKSLKLLHAVAGFVYKLENGQYTSQGKLGAAILGDHETLNYTLLLYKGKQQHVTFSTINRNFQFLIEPKNYAKFPDDRGDQWSINFASEEQLIQFAKQVALAKANSSGNPPSELIVQDLLSGESTTSVRDGDSVDISYTGHIFKNFGFGEVFDESSKSVVRLGKTNVVKGLSEGLMGANKHCKRLLVVPSALGYGIEGNQPTVAPHQTLIFEISVNRIKSSREKSSSPSHKSESDGRPEVMPRTHSVSEDTIRLRGASISEQLTQSPKKDNAKIISRMARMGLPMLPVHTAATHTSSESEPERESERDHPARPSSVKSLSSAPLVQSDIHHEDLHRDVRNISISSPRTASPHLQMQTSAIPYPSYSLATAQGDPMAYYHQSMVPHPTPTYMPPMMPGVLESHIPLLVSETRTQNTEVRLMLGKISDRLDSIVPKIDDMKSQQSSSSLQNPVCMEAAILSQNIERIIQENVQMKKDVEVKTLKIQELNEKICDILQRNQRFFEESNNILEQRSDSLQLTSSQLQSKILSLEQEKAKLSNELTERISNCNKVQLQLNELQTLNTDLKNEFDLSKKETAQLTALLDNLKSQQNETQKFQSGLNGNIDILKAEKETLQSRLEDAKAKLKESTLSLEASNLKLVSLSEAYDPTETDSLRAELHAEKESHMQHKKKHENMREKIHAMKEMYEKQIKHLTIELKEAKTTSTDAHPTQDFSAEIKRAMNVLYKKLQNEIKESQSYGGDEVLRLSLNMIRKVTLSYIGGGGQRSRHSSQKSTESHSSKRSSVDNSVPVETLNNNNIETDDSTLKETTSKSSSPHSESEEKESESASVSQSKNMEPIDMPTEPEIPSMNSLPTIEPSIESNNIDDAPSLENSPTIMPLMNDDDTEATNVQETVNTDALAKDEGAPPPLLVIKQTETRRSPDIWRPQPPTPPLFDEEEDADDWLK